MEALLSVYTQGGARPVGRIRLYALWRIGITETGGWRFFVAGD